MSRTYVQPGKTLTFTAPAGGVTSGTPVIIGSAFVIPKTTAAAAAEFEGDTEGVHELTKAGSQAWTEGQAVHWDQANARATNVASAGPLIGYAASAVASGAGDTKGKVKLTGVPVDRAVSVAAQGTPTPTSKATAGAVTLTAAEVLSGIYVRDCAGAARTDTLPTAALLVAAVPQAKVGDLIRLYVVNGSDAAETLTIAAGTGGAFDANQTAASQVVPQNASKYIHIRLTNVTASSEAYVVYA
jgi:predicted RecA/RadA family phage recombinase